MRSNPFVDQARTVRCLVSIETTHRDDDPILSEIARALSHLFPNMSVRPCEQSNTRSGTIRPCGTEVVPEEPVWPLGELDAEIDPEADPEVA